MVRILLYITSLINFAQIVFYGYLSAINDDYDDMFLLFIAIIAGILVQIGLYVHYKYLQNNIQTPSKPNGEQPGTLGRILGIGGDNAEIFSYPLQVTTSIEVHYAPKEE